MTDNELIKEFKLFIKYSAPENLLNDILDLINRQKAEIERLTNIVDDGAEVCHNCHSKYAEKIKQVKAKAIKEFAERLKETANGRMYRKDVVYIVEIDNLVKEMAGAEK